MRAIKPVNLVVKGESAVFNKCYTRRRTAACGERRARVPPSVSRQFAAAVLGSAPREGDTLDLPYNRDRPPYDNYNNLNYLLRSNS